MNEKDQSCALNREKRERKQNVNDKDEQALKKIFRRVSSARAALFAKKRVVAFLATIVLCFVFISVGLEASIISPLKGVDSIEHVNKNRNPIIRNGLEASLSLGNEGLARFLQSSLGTALPTDEATEAGREHDRRIPRREPDHQAKNIPLAYVNAPRRIPVSMSQHNNKTFTEALNRDKEKAEQEVGFACPTFRYPRGRSADNKAAREAIHKYERYTNDFCNASGVLQMQISFDFYVNTIVEKIVRAVGGLKRGDKVLDLGSGCGTMLNYFSVRYGTVGLGIDVTEAAVKFAMAHRQPNNLFCLLNAETQLLVEAKENSDDFNSRRSDNCNASHIAVDDSASSVVSNTRHQPLPSRRRPLSSKFFLNSFDAIVSWGVLHHIRRTASQCRVVNALIKLLKPGGKAFIGHLRHDKGDYWRRGRCLVEGAMVKRIRDGSYFHVHHWAKYGFGSLLIHKHRNPLTP